MTKRVLICGCGYVGTATGRLLNAEGHEVFGLNRSNRRDEELRAAGIRPLAGDLTRRDNLEQLPGPFDWIVNTVSSGHGGAESYRSVYLEGARTLLHWLRDQPPARLVYTSSTGVYGQDDGSWVDEASPAEPASETGRILRETEREFLQGASGTPVQAQILRVSGIYGPGRGHLFRQFVRGELDGANPPSHWLNMVHRDDVAQAIQAVLKHSGTAPILNVTDDEPVHGGLFLRWIADQLDRPLPVASAGSAASLPGKRMVTNKRISNRRLRNSTGWVPRYPTFREGYAQAVQAVRNGTFA